MVDDEDPVFNSVPIYDKRILQFANCKIEKKIYFESYPKTLDDFHGLCDFDES